MLFCLASDRQKALPLLTFKFMLLVQALSFADLGFYIPRCLDLLLRQLLRNIV